MWAKFVKYRKRMRMRFLLWKVGRYHAIAQLLLRIAYWFDPASDITNRQYQGRYRLYGDRGSWR